MKSAIDLQRRTRLLEAKQEMIAEIIEKAYEKVINLAPDDESIRAARDAMNGWDPSNGCLYYYNPATATSRWIDYYASQGITAIAVDCKSGKGLNKFAPAVNNVLSERRERLKAKGMVNPMLRIMIVGIPNVGKSSFINRVAKQNRAKVEDRPGVTRGNQWYSIAKNIEMLDTPGVLWPKFDDKIVGERLAFTGAVKDQILDTELLAVRLLDFLRSLKPADFIASFKLEDIDLDAIDSYELLNVIGKKRGMLISGGEINTERAAIMLLDEFRSGKLGRITLEMPER